jgi:diacylglycerol kinase family enzyme
MKWLAIINPAANSPAHGHLERIARYLKARLGADCAWTNDRKHALQITQDSSRYEGCLAVGGDGTVAAVVNGLDYDAQRLGVIPTGTGNGLAHDLSLHTVDTALRALRRPQFTALDLVTVRYRIARTWRQCFLISTSGLGFTAQTVRLAGGNCKRLGHLRYAAAAGLQSIVQREFVAEIRMDEGPSRESTVTNLTINNTRHIGPFCTFPEASLTDGRLNLVCTRHRPIEQLIEDLMILATCRGFHGQGRQEARTVEVDLTHPSVLMLDGDIVDGVEAVRWQVTASRLLCCTGSAGTGATCVAKQL